MEQPGQNTRTSSGLTATRDNTAYDNRTGAQIGAHKRFQKLGASNQMKIKLAAASDSTATNIPLICGSGVSRSATPTGITYSGDFSSFALLQDFLINNPIHIKGIRIQTDDTDNYNYVLVKGERKCFNRNPNEEEVYLDDYAKAVGDGYATSAKIMDFDFDVTRNKYLNFSTIKPGTYVIFYLVVDEMEQTADFTPLEA